MKQNIYTRIFHVIADGWRRMREERACMQARSIAIAMVCSQRLRIRPAQTSQVPRNARHHAAKAHPFRCNLFKQFDISNPGAWSS